MDHALLDSSVSALLFMKSPTIIKLEEFAPLVTSVLVVLSSPAPEVLTPQLKVFQNVTFAHQASIAIIAREQSHLYLVQLVITALQALRFQFHVL